MCEDIVIDTDCFYVPKGNPAFKQLFEWLSSKGTLTVSQKLLNEYSRTGSPFIAVLLDRLGRDDRLLRVQTQELKAFKMNKHYRFSCNYEDRWHARLVFVSYRKLLVSLDKRLVKDVNRFKKVDGIEPKACRCPNQAFYLGGEEDD